MNTDTNNTDDVLTTEETAALLRVHPVTVRLAATAGTIPGRRVGNRWRFSRVAILAYLSTPDRQQV